MRHWLLAALLMLACFSPAKAADAGGWGKPVAAQTPVHRLVPRSPEASFVWAADACWRGCAMDCGRHFRACLSADAPGNCIASNDACDRFCQRACRLYGGPLLPIE